MNKAEEWKLLNAAFLPGEIEGVIEAESPDFLVPRGEELFGVEITEAFMSESQARMRMIPGYVGEVLNHRRYRHRTDKRIYPIRRVQYKAQDGSQVDLEAMVHMNPTSEERASRLGAAIIAKAARVSSYRSQCSTVELVLRDRGIFSDTVEKSDLGALFRSKTLRTIIQQSGFREVRYLVQAKDGGHFCYPIRMGFLAEEILLFFGALAEARITASPVDAGSALSSHLAQTGFQSISVFATEDGRLVVSAKWQLLFMTESSSTSRFMITTQRRQSA